MSAIMALKEGRLARLRLAATLLRPTEIAGNPAPHKGPSFRAGRAAKGDYFPPLFTHPGAGGFVEMTQDIWGFCAAISARIRGPTGAWVVWRGGD